MSVALSAHLLASQKIPQQYRWWVEFILRESLQGKYKTKSHCRFADPPALCAYLETLGVTATFDNCSNTLNVRWDQQPQTNVPEQYRDGVKTTITAAMERHEDAFIDMKFGSKNVEKEMLVYLRECGFKVETHECEVHRITWTEHIEKSTCETK